MSRSRCSRLLPGICLAVSLFAGLAHGEIAAPEDAPMFVPPPANEEEAFSLPLRFSKKPVGKRNILYVWGGVNEGDSERFRAAVEAAKPIEEVWFFSPGGSLEDGLQIGRIIHGAKLTTHIKRGMECISACNFMFMGGTVRLIEPGGIFGVHMFSTNEYEQISANLQDMSAKSEEYNKQNPNRQANIDKIRLDAMDEAIKSVQQNAAQTAAEIARFLAEMQLSLRFLTAFAIIPNDQPRALTRDELRDFNIVNAD